MTSSSINYERKRPWWLLPIALVIVIAAIMFLLISSKAAPPVLPQAEKTWSVRHEVLQLQSLSPQVDLLGSVESRFSGKLTAALNAYVETVPAKEGMQVAKGQLLVQLQGTDARITLQQRDADVAAIEAQIVSENVRYEADKAALEKEKQLLDIAQRDLQRQKRLVSSNLASQEKIDNAQTSLSQRALSITSRDSSIADHPNRLQQLQASLQKARAARDDANLDLQRTRIVAPFNGRITRITVSPGDWVNIGQTLVSLYDDSSIEVRAQIPQKYIAQVQQALADERPLSASVSVFGKDYRLLLDRLSGQINAGTGGVDGLFVPQDSQGLIVGTAMKLRLSLPTVDGIYSAPMSALYGSDRIYRIAEQRLAGEKIEIVGYYLDDQDRQRLIFRSDKLKPGASINTTQLPNAITGLKVALKQDRPEDSPKASAQP